MTIPRHTCRMAMVGVSTAYVRTSALHASFGSEYQTYRNQVGRARAPGHIVLVYKQVGKGQMWRVGVAGAVVHKGRVLLVRHTYGRTQGCWALPGGYTTPGERLDECAVRELWEETGLKTEVADVIGMVTQYTEQDSAVFAVLRMRPCQGQVQPRPDGAEVDEVGWFSAAEVAAMPDQVLWADSRRPALAALRGQDGLLEDELYPGRNDQARGFLVRWE
jgi:8-oxo-dGTP diphosphatase